MVVEKPKMAIEQKVFYILSAIFLIWAFIYLGTKNYSIKDQVNDAEKFTIEYGIEQNNVFVYKKAKDILETLNNGTALIFMAFPENKWSSNYADLINKLAKQANIKEIYYYNFYKDRQTDNFYYENIVDYLHSYITILDDETKNIYAPTFIIVKNGKVIYFDSETSITTENETINNYYSNTSMKENEINKYLNIFKGNSYER